MKVENKIPQSYANVLGIAMGLISPEQVPSVPADSEQMRMMAEGTKRYMSESQREQAPRALAEIATRGQAHGRELGDLAPVPETCGQFAAEMQRLTQSAARLRALADYLDKRRAVIEGIAHGMIYDAASQAEPRITRGMLPSESYNETLAYGAIHSEAVTKGRSRAKKARASVKRTAPALPANDTQGLAKTGSDPR